MGSACHIFRPIQEFAPYSSTCKTCSPEYGAGVSCVAILREKPAFFAEMTAFKSVKLGRPVPDAMQTCDVLQLDGSRCGKPLQEGKSKDHRCGACKQCAKVCLQSDPLSITLRNHTHCPHNNTVLYRGLCVMSLGGCVCSLSSCLAARSLTVCWTFSISSLLFPRTRVVLFNISRSMLYCGKKPPHYSVTALAPHQHPTARYVLRCMHDRHACGCTTCHLQTVATRLLD